MNTTENIGTTSRFDRRTWVAMTSVQLGALAFIKDLMPSVLGNENVAPLNRDPRMLHEWYVEKVQSVDRHHFQAIEALRTKGDALRYVSDIQQDVEKVRCL